MTSGTTGRLQRAGVLFAWSALTVAGLVLTAVGLPLSSYFVGTEEELEKARAGVLLILSGSLALMASAVWARWLHAPLWAWILVASPALVVGGLTIALGNSLLPLLVALVVFPFALVGVIGVLVLARPTPCPPHTRAWTESS